ncbi:MAG TPA: hypothetical protein VIT45_06090 [Allosphingosinicella sp.]
MKLVLACLAAPAFLISCQSAAPADARAARASQTSCATDSDARQVSGTIKSFFAALAKDDDAAVTRLTTSDFYAYDVGKRYTGPELSRLIADLHRSGRVLEWNIGPVDARIDCNLAFAAWENVGASGTASEMKPRTWLESALLVREDDRWLIRFLHSTPKDPRP